MHSISLHLTHWLCARNYVAWELCVINLRAHKMCIKIHEKPVQSTIQSLATCQSGFIIKNYRNCRWHAIQMHLNVISFLLRPISYQGLKLVWFDYFILLCSFYRNKYYSQTYGWQINYLSDPYTKISKHSLSIKWIFLKKNHSSLSPVRLIQSKYLTTFY